MEIRDVILYVVWLKEKGRKNGEEVLDCLHVAAGATRMEKEIAEYALGIVKKAPESFSIGEISPDKIEATVIKLAVIEKGTIETEIMMD